MQKGFWISVSVLGFCWTVMATDPLIIAHRGASEVAPENTQAAISRAIEMGAPVIEFDVRTTSDGELVLFHDETLERIAGRKQAIETLTREEVAKLDVGRWFGDGSFAGERAMGLADAITLCLEANVTPLIERKTGEAGAYFKVIEELEVRERVILQSFDWKFLQELATLAPELRLGALGSKKLSRSRFEDLKKLRPTWVGWKSADLTARGCSSLLAEGFLVALWTVNEKTEAENWIRMGANGIITDRPDAMLSLLR